MSVTAFVLAILASWIASNIVFPVVPLQQWLNNWFRLLWNMVTLRPIGLTGRWLAVYKMTRPAGGQELRTEIVWCRQLSGSEIRGSIRDESTGYRYNFSGRLVFDELVAHYWSVDRSRDIGNFKLVVEQGAYVLKGPLTLLLTRSTETISGVDYHWYRYPNKVILRFKKVRAGISLIGGTGLFSNDRFETGHEIGQLRLARVAPQGKHTVKFKEQHRVVKKPWRYLNHSCDPNAELKWHEDRIALVAR